MVADRHYFLSIYCIDMSDYNAYWFFCAALLLMLMVFFGDFLYREYWGGNIVVANAPGAPPKRNYVKLNQNPIVVNLGN